MSMTRKQLAVLHVAKNKLGLSDDQYRNVLATLAGVTSSKDLDRGGFEAVMGYFDYMGFKPLAARGPSYGERPGMASYAQIALVRQLWAEFTRGAYDDDQALCKWLERVFKVSSLRFLKAETAPKVITALKAMKARRA